MPMLRALAPSEAKQISVSLSPHGARVYVHSGHLVAEAIQQVFITHALFLHQKKNSERYN